jgi:ubiquinone/menaquinone biosynthesis C-methylase UbiE
MQGRIKWPLLSHESRVELFYQRGVEHYGNYHGGYLNFGLWEDGITVYQQAAEHMVKRLAEKLSLTPESHLLDIACGMGAQDVLLQETYGCKITALDVTWKHVIAARERMRKAKLQGQIAVLHGTAVDLPLKDNSVDAVLCVEGTQHFKPKKQFLEEAYRVLKPGGKIAIGDFTALRTPESPIGASIFKSVMEAWSVPMENFMKIEDYPSFLQDHGFHLTYLESVGDKTIPGYYKEQTRFAHLKSIAHIRGLLTTGGGFIADYLAYRAYKDKYIDYVLVAGEKI